MNELINFDANASYGLLDEVRDELFEILGKYLNPSSVHQGGQKAKNLIEDARDEVRLLIGASPRERVIFTSGATESNNMALFGVFENTSKRHLVTSMIEHPAILEPSRKLEESGVRVSYVHPDQEGRICSSSIKSFFSEQTKLVSIMFANNETGILNPVHQIAKDCKQENILFHTDAVQALGKVEIKFSESSIDMMSLSAHKIGGLAGVGALVLREGVYISPLIHGGPQETFQRAGTENVIGILSFGIAARKIREKLNYRIQRMNALGEALREKIALHIPGIIQFDSQPKLTNTISLRIPGVRADDLIVALDLQGLLVSAGSACASGKPSPSHALTACGLTESEAKETLRISLRAETKYEELLRGVKILADTVSSFNTMKKPLPVLEIEVPA